MAGLIDYSSRRRGGNTNQTSEPSIPDSETTAEQQEVLKDEETSRGPTNTYTAGDDQYTTTSDDPYGTGYTKTTDTQTETETETETDTAPVEKGYTSRNIPVEKREAAGADSEYSEAQDQRYGDQEEGGFFDPSFPSYEQEAPLQMPFFDHVVVDYGEMGIVGKTRLMVRQALSFGLTLGGLGLVLVLSFAAYLNPLKKGPARAKPDREYERRITGERLSGRPEYYSEFWGYNCDIHDIVTEGGWILKAHRISDPRRRGPPGHPVVLQHGIFCNSSHFFMCEERSMAFWLVDQGYDVWVTNIRANFEAGHTEFKESDPRYWAWGIKELAFDLRDVVEFICGATGKPRVAYVGHSQGSGSMYLALSPGLCPELGRRLSCFVALGPSVYAGPVLRKFPFSLLRTFRGRRWWSLVFGVKEFIPAIGLFQKYLPAFWFGHLGYVIFAYLFSFHDHNWVRRQKPKIFRSLPVPTSSELLYWYMASFSHRGCIFDPRMGQPWWPQTFPPHSIVYGDIDMLVLGKPLVHRIERCEKNLRVVHAVELEGYEHLDMIFGVDAIRTCFPVIKDTIESTLDPSERPAPIEESDDGYTESYTGSRTDSYTRGSRTNGYSRGSRTDGYTDTRTDGYTDTRTDGYTDGYTDGDDYTETGSQFTGTGTRVSNRQSRRASRNNSRVGSRTASRVGTGKRSSGRRGGGAYDEDAYTETPTESNTGYPMYATSKEY